MGIKTTQNFTLISKLLRKMWKIANKKVRAKKSVKNQRFSSSIQLTCKSVWQITFSGCIFFRLFPQIWNQRKILRILNTHMPKKQKKNFGVIEYIYEYMLELVECKFARKGLTNWKTFLTNVFENIIWHLFAGESHQVVKITVPYVEPWHIGTGSWSGSADPDASD